MAQAGTKLSTVLVRAAVNHAAAAVRGGDLSQVALSAQELPNAFNTGPVPPFAGHATLGAAPRSNQGFFNGWTGMPTGYGAMSIGAQSLPAMLHQQQQQQQLSATQSPFLPSAVGLMQGLPKELLMSSHQLMEPTLGGQALQHMMKLPHGIHMGLPSSSMAAPQLGGQQQQQQQRNKPRVRGSNASIALNKDIMGSNSVEQLLYIVRTRGHEFDFFNISTAIARAPKLVEAAGNMHMLHPQEDMTTTMTAGIVLPDALPGTCTPTAASIAARSSSSPTDAARSADQQHLHHASPAGSGTHLSPAARELADRLCALVIEHVHEFDGRGLANTAWAFGKLRYVPDPALPALLCHEAAAKLPEFAPQNVSNLAWALVYMHHRDERLLRMMKEKACEQVCDLKPQELANIMWALASQEQLDAATAHTLGARAARLASLFKEQELSNIVWALGRAGHRDERLMAPLLAEARNKLHHFAAQGVSNVVWALGQVQVVDRGLMHAVAQHCAARLHQFDSQALTNLASGLSALGCQDKHLMHAIAGEAASRAGRMAPQQLMSVLGSCAALDINNDKLVAAAASLLQTRAGAMDVPGLATCAYSFARLGHHNPALFSTLAGALMARMDRLGGQSLAHAAWAFAIMSSAGKLDQHGADILRALAARVPAAAPSLTAEQCMDVAWALSRSYVMTTAAASTLLRRMVSIEQTHANTHPHGSHQHPPIEPQEVQKALFPTRLSSVLTFVAQSGLWNVDIQVLPPLQAAFAANMQGMTAQELASSTWALAVLDGLDPATFLAAADLLTRHLTAADLTRGQLHQVYQARLLLHSSLAQQTGVPLDAVAQEALPQLPQPLHGAAMAAWIADGCGAGRPSSDNLSTVVSALHAAGVPHASMWMTDDSQLRVHLALQLPGACIALEVPDVSSALAESLVRSRLLTARGWQVVMLTSDHVDAIVQMPETQRAAALLSLVASELGSPSLNWSEATAPTPGAAQQAACLCLEPAAVSEDGTGVAARDALQHAHQLLDAQLAAAAGAAPMVSNAVLDASNLADAAVLLHNLQAAGLAMADAAWSSSAEDVIAATHAAAAAQPLSFRPPLAPRAAAAAAGGGPHGNVWGIGGGLGNGLLSAAQALASRAATPTAALAAVAAASGHNSRRSSSSCMTEGNAALLPAWMAQLDLSTPKAAEEENRLSVTGNTLLPADLFAPWAAENSGNNVSLAPSM